MSVEDFRKLFSFKSELTLHVGIEREFFLINETGGIIPDAPRVISGLHKGKDNFWGGTVWPYLPKMYSYELSACQIETRTEPVSVASVYQELLRCENQIMLEEENIGFRRSTQEVAPDNMPLDVYPDPSGRYKKIAEQMSRDRLLAACQVIGTHVHVGMPNHEVALKVYNFVRRHCERLSAMGDHSEGKRLAIYRLVAPDCDPKPYESWDYLYQAAQDKGFNQDPRSCWTLIRISIHGTIEFRMFGTTDNLHRIESWAKICHSLCLEAMVN